MERIDFNRHAENLLDECADTIAYVWQGNMLQSSRCDTLYTFLLDIYGTGSLCERTHTHTYTHTHTRTQSHMHNIHAHTCSTATERCDGVRFV